MLEWWLGEGMAVWRVELGRQIGYAGATLLDGSKTPPPAANQAQEMHR